ncbi:MAG: hypothetical protein WBP87_16475, partial [Candidatus Sulfotelmatobacter sp.]
MSRKKFCLDRRRDLFLEIQPTVFGTLKMFGLWSILVSFLCCWWQRSSWQDAASRTMLTMVLSEARGL